MKSDKELKAEFKKVFSKAPELYYPVSVLKSMGFTRGECKACGKHFWAADSKRKLCGDSACTGSYDFIAKRITKVKLSYPEVWFEFKKMFESIGYKGIARYPVVARWRDDTLYVKASIYDFQPHVTSGMSPPPAKKLVVPQTCLRFNDVDNVGVTMSHMTGFVMIGQHAFLPKEEWSQEQLFKDICKWLFDVLKIPSTEVIFHEDAWAGGGNLGPCMEYFSGGVELGNQVYMLYEMSESGPKELSLKVLDMGMGMERVAWFTQATGTIYDATFPETLSKIFKKVGFSPDKKLLEKYVPFGAKLNLDEIDDVQKNMALIAKGIGLSAKELEKFLKPTSALYSIAEHARSLLIALNDGSLPSNVGDAYNLRMLFRRAQNLIDENKFPLDLGEVCHWHAIELKQLFPELLENIDDVKKILQVELQKHRQSKEKANSIIKRLIDSKEKPTVAKLVELYDSQGINPNELKAAADEAGLKIEIPQNFYSLVSERHEAKESAVEKKSQVKLPKLSAPTDLLFYQDAPLNFKAKVIAVLADGGIILDKTNFYPEGGGQEHDTGTINGLKVENVEKIMDWVIHHVEGKHSLKPGDEVECRVDAVRRKQLSIHHTATHIVNGAARMVLGNHVYQAGAKKTTTHARLDITHFESLTPKEVKAIEDKANELVKRGIPIIKNFMDRAEAERRYGIRIYQGGYIPGKKVRIVEVKGIDVEACGGTHLDNTKEVGEIRIIKTSKIQDGVVRLEYVAGEAAKKYSETSDSNEAEIAAVFKVPVTSVKQTIERFTSEVTKMGTELNTIEKSLGKPITKIAPPNVVDEKTATQLFEAWKTASKCLAGLTGDAANIIAANFREGSVEELDASPELLREVANKFKAILLINKEGFFVFKGSDSAYKKLLAKGARCGGAEIKQGKLTCQPKEMKGIFS